MISCRWLGIGLSSSCLITLTGPASSEAQALPAPAPIPGTNSPGGGFSSGVHTLSFEAGAVGGLKILGSSQRHDLALASLAYGWMTGPVRGQDHWYRGNWELRAELFGGSEFSPGQYCLAGLTPHLRYDFATGTRWIPFIDAGAGLTATGIGRPDLSNDFEFNLQAGTGLHWLVRDNWAVTLEARYFHISDAGMTYPNNGVNGVMGMIGITRFF